MTARVRPLKEGKYHPSIVIGTNDPFKDMGTNYFATVYGVLTKSFSIVKDSDGFNVGSAVRLWKHLSVHVFTREFNCIAGGIRYECTLIH